MKDTIIQLSILLMYDAPGHVILARFVTPHDGLVQCKNTKIRNDPSL